MDVGTTEKKVFLSCNYCTQPIAPRISLPSCTCRTSRSKDTGSLALEASPCPYSPRAQTSYGVRAPPILVSSPRSELPVLINAVNGGTVPGLTSKAQSRAQMALTALAPDKLYALLAKYTRIVERQNSSGKESHEAYVRRATLLAAVGQYGQSRDDAHRACELAPTSAVARFRLGIAEYELGNYANAVDAFVIGLQYSPTSIELKDAFNVAMSALRTRPLRLEPLRNLRK